MDFALADVLERVRLAWDLLLQRPSIRVRPMVVDDVDSIASRRGPRLEVAVHNGGSTPFEVREVGIMDDTGKRHRLANGDRPRILGPGEGTEHYEMLPALRPTIGGATSVYVELASGEVRSFGLPRSWRSAPNGLPEPTPMD